MIKIRLITLGKLKESYLQEAEREYLKRIAPFVDMKIQELRNRRYSLLQEETSAVLALSRILSRLAQ